MPIKRPSRKVPRKPRKVNAAGAARRAPQADKLAREVMRAWPLFERAAQSSSTVTEIVALLNKTHAPSRVRAAMVAFAKAPRRPRGKLSWRAQLVQLLVRLAACGLFDSTWHERKDITSEGAVRELRRAAIHLMEIGGLPINLLTPERLRARVAQYERELLGKVRHLISPIRDSRTKLRKLVARSAGDLSIALNLHGDGKAYGTTDVMGEEAECYKRFREHIDYATNTHGIDVLAVELPAGDRTTEKTARKKARRVTA
jgi:hypothetical protein